MVAKIESVIIKRPQDAFIGRQNLANLWQVFNYTACPDYEKALLEFTHFEKVLQQHVAKIYYLPRHEKAGLDSIYTHAPLKIPRRGAILMNMAKPLRAAEPQVLQAWLAQIGIPVLGKIETPGRMEGGDADTDRQQEQRQRQIVGRIADQRHQRGRPEIAQRVFGNGRSEDTQGKPPETGKDMRYAHFRGHRCHTECVHRQSCSRN